MFHHSLRTIGWCGKIFDTNALEEFCRIFVGWVMQLLTWKSFWHALQLGLPSSFFDELLFNMKVEWNFVENSISDWFTWRGLAVLFFLLDVNPKTKYFFYSFFNSCFFQKLWFFLNKDQKRKFFILFTFICKNQSYIFFSHFFYFGRNNYCVLLLFSLIFVEFSLNFLI